MSSSSVISWGDLKETEIYGRKSSEDKYHLIDKDTEEYSNSIHAAHCMIYYKSKMKNKSVATVLMQMRFDGYFGFPGGLIDKNETIMQGLNRELIEEINWKPSKTGFVGDEHYQFSHYNIDTDLVLHFYAFRVDYETIKEIEINSVEAEEHGNGSLGLVRVPLYTMGDGYRGFPGFLHNNFAGYAKYQLVESLNKLNILPEAYIRQALTTIPVKLSKKRTKKF